MKLIESKAELIQQKPGLCGIYEQIEIAGRTCYKSEGKIAENHKAFVDRMIKSKHYAMLEHGTVYLDCPENIFQKYNSNKFSKGVIINTGKTRGKDIYKYPIYKYYVTTNLRVLVENNWLDDLRYVCEPTEYHTKRVMVRFICDRGVSHEIVRHRGSYGMSYAQESTRYCNYSKSKFGQELTFIEPAWEFPSSNIVNTRERFEAMLEEAEANYMELITLGFKPQEARAVLPNALKTEIVVTGFIEDWKHFFELRCDNAAHPDIRKLALDLQKQFIERNLI